MNNKPLQFLPDSLFESAANYLVSAANEPPVLIFLDGQYVFCWTEEGRIRTKLISSSSVHSAFSQETVDSGWLTPNIVRCGICAQGNWSVRFTPPSKLNLHFLFPGETVYLCIPMPGLVFFGINQKYYIWAIKQDTFNPASVLHHAPFPNIDTGIDNQGIPGRICFGENSLPIANPVGIEKAWQIFLDAVFTDHMITGKSTNNKKDIRSLLIMLSGKRKYPTRTLIPVSGNYTIDGAINRAVNNSTLKGLSL